MESVKRIPARSPAENSRTAELSLFYRLAHSAPTPTLLEEVLSLSLEELCKIMQVENSFVYLEKAEVPYFRLAAHRGETPPSQSQWPRHDPVLSPVVDKGKSITLTAENASRLVANSQTIALVPMINRSIFYGICGIATSASRAFSLQEIAHLETVVNLVTMAVANIRLHQHLENQATTDPLTGLHSRPWFLERVQQELNRYQRYSEPFSLLLVDMDHFQQYNDTYGRLAGDHVLKQMGSLLRHTIRNVDLVARYGGEEFICLLPMTDARGAFSLGKRLHQLISSNDLRIDSALTMAERIRASVAQIHAPGTNNASSPITVSIGVVEMAPPIKTTEDLLRRVEQALQRAKQTGRNKICVYWEE